MTAKSRIISHFLFFFVFFALATNYLVHGNDAYNQCIRDCKKKPDPYVRWPCIQHYCENLKDVIELGSHKENKFDKEHGRVGLPQNFAENSNLLTGLVNHGVNILEANPNTFMMTPGHWDVDAFFFFVVQGKATINMIRQDKRETLGLKTGDIIQIPSGTKVLMINKDTMENLIVIKLPQPVSTSLNNEQK